ncbi:MAG: TauD/TfdA family dioxygenase, partial [Gammaproteobacteria bacterium]|nr:TauD/TfdA family dioxygenase [Gammaproteobacteria bacterium]
MNLCTRLSPVPSQDITYASNASRTPLVVTPAALGIEADAASLFAFFEEHRTQMREHMDAHGALLLRGFSLDGPDDFQSSLTRLGYELMDKNLGGASPRSRIKDKVFVSTAAPKPFIIGFHTEFVYQQKRPGVIAFFCEEAPAIHGETPIFDCARVYSSLSEELRDKLETLGVRYQRRFYGRKSLFNFRKTWSDVFYTKDRSEVEKYFQDEGVDYRWETDGTLVTQLNVPAVITDYHTGQKLLSITMFNGESFAYNFWHFQERYSLAKRYLMDWLVRRETQPKNRFLYITLGDGTPFTRDES